ncbi:MAG TPA: DHH family phosphoesterase, partial [Cryomorphaceae bacterium]|nr:DHH family phosphoesterase [Cryomorphaceae bacterium]
MLRKASVVEIKTLLDAGPKCAIVMHRGPDGDAIGSSLGWFHLLQKQGIHSTVIAPDAYPDFLKWMPGNEDVLVYEKSREKTTEVLNEADLIFCLDFNAPDRMGNLKD